MSDHESSAVRKLDWPAEVARLEKINRALMDRAERSTSVQGSAFSLFQTTVMLEEHVRLRTAELEEALRENEKTSRALRTAEARFRGVVNQSLVGILLIEDGRISYTNAKFDEMSGLSAAQALGSDPMDFVTEGDRPLVRESMRARASGEANQTEYKFRALRRDGEIIDVEVYGSVVDIDGRRTMISMLLDITERTRIEKEMQVLQATLREQSTHDALTGLYNRRYLEESLERELILAKRIGGPVSVVMGDLDHFKVVNDEFGHLAGDEVLRVFGDLMKRSSRGSDIYCRYGGEEFLLVLPGMTVAGAVDRAEQLRIAFAAKTVSFGELQISVTASFGVAHFPLDGDSGDELIAAADRALYSAKASGRNCVTSVFR